ncbi:TonB-dependent receptor plug domain-containing protein [Puniceibacterium sediminis]|uniref:Vitamin B12 transporter n=1 Tax=Puniceibacterium sediminis TaxID=1608407 RepID=A0A238UYT3_9RHOB|nr:TonB-dependent receptor [Puniceibacterium sediminis]SNR26463.1 vitamin B12 transporter [Puniceibacterium sediminis]
MTRQDDPKTRHRGGHDPERFTMTRLLCGASLFALATIPAVTPRAAAAQDILQLDPITVYANQSDLPLSRTGASVDIIDADEIKGSASDSLTDIMSQTPGVTFTQAGGPGGLSYSNTGGIRIRGLGDRYVTVLLNGIDISDPSSPQTSFDWKNVLGGGIGRVEIVKGAQSALYGSEAVGGLVALTAADAAEEPGTSGSVGIEVGSYGTRRATLSYGVSTDRSGLAVTASRTRTDGFSAFSSDSEKDGFAGGQYSFDAYYDLTPDLRLGLTGFSFDSEFDYDSGANTADTRTRGLRAYVEATTGPLQHTFDISRFTMDRTTPLGFTPEFEGMRDKIGYNGSWTASPALTLSYGADWTQETADSFTKKEVRVTGAFTEMQYAATPDLDLALSVRHDENSQFGGFTTGRAALTWRARNDLTLRSTLANGFRAPSLNELYGNFGANPKLDPEQSRSFDLGVEKTFVGGASVTATLFYTEIDDLIDYTTAYNQIDGTSASKGIELSGKMPVTDRITLTGAFTYTDSRDKDENPLQRVPRYALDLGILADITDQISAAASLTRRADLAATYGASGVQSVPSDYTVVNAKLGYDFGNGVEGYVRVENLFDEQYEAIPGYQTSDRAAYFGVVASF